MSGVATLFHSDLIKGNCCVTKHHAYFLSEPLWNKCCRFQVGLVWNVREICGRRGVSETHWPLPPCHMCKRFIKPRSEVRRLGFCFLFHTGRCFNWVQISGPPSNVWQWHPFKKGPITAQRQSKSNNFTLIMTRCICQYTSSQGNSLTAFHCATMIFRMFIYYSSQPSSPFYQCAVKFFEIKGGLRTIAFSCHIFLCTKSFAIIA